MALRGFKRVKLSDTTLAQLQDNVADFANQIVKNPLLSGRLIEGVGVINGVTAVNHGLGRKPVGYIVVKRSANVSVWTVEANQNTPLATIALSADATATISIYVF